jgi:hypothetical protein
LLVSPFLAFPQVASAGKAIRSVWIHAGAQNRAQTPKSLRASLPVHDLVSGRKKRLSSENEY